jgi:GT2 family glycosyltransferase
MMSSLVYFPSGKTFDYWWERLKYRPHRHLFLLTKILEILIYKLSKTRNKSLQSNPVRSIFQLQPKIAKNNVTPESKIAVIIPAKCSSDSDSKRLHRLISKLNGQNALIIVVNDESSHFPKLAKEVRVLTHSQCQGPAAARNTGIRAALDLGADAMLFADADCIPDINWVREARQGFLENPYIHAISGCTNAANQTWFDRYHEINGTLNGRRFKNSNILLYGPTCNLAIARQVAESIQFDESFPNAACEDIDFCFQMLNAGFRSVYRPSMAIAHDYQFQPRKFWLNLYLFAKQFRKYAASESILLAKIPDYYAYFGQTEEITCDRDATKSSDTIELRDRLIKWL